MEEAKRIAMRILNAMGCTVDEIPETDEKRADLQAKDATSDYLIEVKHKLDAPELFGDHSERMARGEVVPRAAIIAQTNRIGAILKHGTDQLESTPGPSGTFRLIWFHADGIDRDLHWKRAFATFYGRVHLLPRYPPGNRVVECYYFDYSAAWALPSVDAMILSDAQGVQLCLNEFSNHADRFCESALYRRFAVSNAVCDPRELAANGDILVCRSDIPRKDDNLVLNALRQEMGVLYTVIRFSQHSASARVDTGDAIQRSVNRS